MTSNLSSQYPTIISYYTEDWLYQKYALELEAQCESLKLPCLIKQLNSENDYLKNCRKKPSAILDSLLEVKRPVLWIDADGGILKRPDFFVGLECDFAARRMPANRDRHWHVGTMWFNYNSRVINFLEDWILYTKDSSTDEAGLDKLWKRNPNMVTSKNIPKTYFHLLLGGNKTSSSCPKDTVIFHRISTGSSKMAMKKRNLLV